MAPPLSTSLPRGFRYNLPSPLPCTHSFYAQIPHQSESPAPSVSQTAAKTRLEVLHGWEVSFAVVCLYAAAALALVYVVLKLHRFAAFWDLHHTVPHLSPPERAFRSLLRVFFVLLPLAFAATLAHRPAAATHEQLWTAALLAVALFASNPLTRDASPAPLAPAARATLVWNDAVYTSAVLLYLLLAAHSYRVFDVARLHTLAFYIPKIAVSALYLLVRVAVGHAADVSLGLVPYARLLTWLRLLRSGRASLRVTAPVLLSTTMDTAFGFLLVREVAATADFLATVPYVEHRAKQLGFRCFVYQTLAFCFNMIGLSILITYLLPPSFVYSAYDDPQQHFFQLEPPVARLALAFVYFTWTLVLAYVNLPPHPIMPFLQAIIHRSFFFLRSSRVAVWFGLADFVNTVDAEDSSEDEDDANPDNYAHQQTQFCPAEMHHHNLGTFLQQQPIPFRYCHRELFDEVVLSPQRAESFSSLALNTIRSSSARALSSSDFCSDSLAFGSSNIARADNSDLSLARPSWNGSPGAASASTTVPLPPTISMRGHPPPLHVAPSIVPPKSCPINITTDSSGFLADSLHSPHILRDSLPTIQRVICTPDVPFDPVQKGSRLRMRKNLFVMETQVMLANAAYLSYIPGNRKEERARASPRTPSLSRSQTPLLYTGSLANDLDELARQIEEENISLYGKPGPKHISQELRPEPDHDDGTMFLVDPHEMTQKYGYRLYRHFSDDKLNTHAIVLVHSSRVIVAFSGTRDVTNWGVNANINRVVLDDKLSRFEYEFENSSNSDSEQGVAVGDYNDWHTRESQLQSQRPDGGTNQKDDNLLRRSKSEEGMSSIAGSAHGSSNTTPMQLDTSILPSYGTVQESKKRLRLLPEASTELDHSESFGFATHEGVTRMANTFARELMTFGKPKVHEGFINAYMSLRKKVMGALVELYGSPAARDIEEGKCANDQPAALPDSLPLFFCGHSLGGALATFASYEAARYFRRIGLRRRQDISCTTFGCPTMGNEAFKARYERLVETHWRFEIASDPIPKVPIVLLNYVHVGVQVLMDQSGVLLIDPSFIEVKWWGLLSNLYLGYRLHIRASYCMALRTYCKRYKSGSDDLSDSFWPFPIRAQTKGLFHHAP